MIPGQTCFNCGQPRLEVRAVPQTIKRRSKFGFWWLLITVLTAGFGLFVYLVWPRKNVTVNVDRFYVCAACGARQP